MKTLALLTAHAAAQPPSDEVPAMPKNVRTITAEECRNEILRQDILFRTYLSLRLGGIIGRRRNRNVKANEQKCVHCRAKLHPCQAVAANDEGLGVLTI